LEEREGEFRSLNVHGMRGGGTPGWPICRGAKGQAYPTGQKKKSEKQISLFLFSKFFLILLGILDF
jgi:hypothetical protein